MDTKSYLSSKFEVKNLEIKSEDAGEFAYFSGYASVYGNEDHYGDIVALGAFDMSLKKRMPKLCWQHDIDTLIGSVLSAKSDAHGLFIEGRINLGTVKGKECYALLKAGDLNSMSIGYTTARCEWDEEKSIRTIMEAELYEVSLVVFPANEMAVVTDVKSIEQANTLSDIEAILRRNGFTQKGAKTLISKTKNLVGQRDVESPSGQRDVDSEVSNLVLDIKNLTKTLNTNCLEGTNHA